MFLLYRIDASLTGQAWVAVQKDDALCESVGIDATKARRHADDVQRSLVEFGLPPSRIRTDSQSSAAASTSEVRLFWIGLVLAPAQ